jgi:uncharacterized membrane protein YphA (DoxX/SURF4 family)
MRAGDSRMRTAAGDGCHGYGRVGIAHHPGDDRSAVRRQRLHLQQGCEGTEAATADTALVFPWKPEWFTLAGVFWMLAGRLSVLLGIFPRLGAVALTLFLIPAAMIHFRKARQAATLKDAILARSGGASSGMRQDMTALGESAVLGNFTSALKNLNLMALTLYVALAGAEPMLIGFGPDGQLHGLLTRF